jgi:hypothetical protein
VPIEKLRRLCNAIVEEDHPETLTRLIAELTKHLRQDQVAIKAKSPSSTATRGIRRRFSSRARAAAKPLNTVNPVYSGVPVLASFCRALRGNSGHHHRAAHQRLCDLAAREHDYTKLKNVIEELLECIDTRQQQREEAKKISFFGGGEN